MGTSYWTLSGFMQVSVSGGYIFGLAPFTYANMGDALGGNGEYDTGYQLIQINKMTGKIVFAEEYGTHAAVFNKAQPNAFFNQGVSSSAIFHDYVAPPSPPFGIPGPFEHTPFWAAPGRSLFV